MSDRYEALAKVIYSQIAFQGGSDEHFESVRGGMYDDAAQAVVEFLTSDEVVDRAISASLGFDTSRFEDEEIDLARRDYVSEILAAVGGSGD